MVGKFTYIGCMEEFLKEVRSYADALGVQPSTVVQRAAQVGGLTWAKWEAGTGSPTLKTADKIRDYIKNNPVPVGGGDIAAFKEAS